jgi:hypothetical protein
MSQSSEQFLKGLGQSSAKDKKRVSTTALRSNDRPVEDNRTELPPARRSK